MEEYDDKTGLPLDILSFLLHITVPGHYIARTPYHTYDRIVAQFESISEIKSQGWDITVMGSYRDGLSLPLSYNYPSKRPTTREVRLIGNDFEINTDLDIWLSRPEFPIGFMPTSAPLAADTSVCPPGYARVKLNTTATATVQQIISRYPGNRIPPQMLVDGDILIQGRAIFEGLVIDPEKCEGTIRGPAVSLRAKHYQDDMPMDVIYVLICKEWPQLGLRWERRQRRGGWPSPEFISDLKQLGCDFVQVPSHNSTNPEFEWRIAFSLIEQKLCQSFTTVQRQCFLIAKVIMKRNLESCEGYSTYLLKNTMFWMMEDLVLTDWQEENALARYLILLLETFQTYLEKENLPHYFIEERNLIGHIPYKFREEMIEKTNSVRRSLHMQILLHCSLLHPIEGSYNMYKEHWFSLFHTTLKYSPDVGLNLKQKILRFMVIILVLDGRIELLVNILKQHGHLLDPLLHDPAPSCAGEKAWISKKMGRIFTDLDVPTQNFLSPNLSGLFCLYYYNLHKDESLLKPAFDHFADALKSFCHIRVHGYTLAPSVPMLCLLQVLTLKAMRDYQKALNIITTIAACNEKWHRDKNLKLPMTVLPEFCALFDTVISVKPGCAVNSSVRDITVYMSVQLFVLLDRFSEAESWIKHWTTQAPAILPPNGTYSTLHSQRHSVHHSLVGLAYVWVSNFKKAALIFASLKFNECLVNKNICALCDALSRIVKS